jgi:thiol-disulfide isomerase/thioredoxin
MKTIPMTALSALFLLSACFDTDKESTASPPPFGGADGDADDDGGGDADGGADDADDDDDGFTNSEEADAGTNPDYIYSHPYTGGYNVGFCDTPPVATGATATASVTYEGEINEWPTLSDGDVPNNMTFMDQHGEMVDLYSFCGKHVMILISAGWCGPCRSLAETVQALQDEYRDDGLQIIEMMTGDNSNGVPSQGFLESWADEYDFDDIPVLSIPVPTSYDAPQFLFDNDGYIPSVYHLNTKLEVVSADESVHDPGAWL